MTPAGPGDIGAGGGGVGGAPRPHRPDPMGKRALFSAPSSHPPAPGATAPIGQPDGSGAGPAAGPGRRALFSAPAVGARSVIVDCRHCGRRSPVGVTALMWRLVPSLWRPASRYSRYMRCPGCGRFGWCRVDWTVFRPR